MMWTTLGYLALLVALITVDYDRVLSHCRKVAFGLYKPRLATDASTCPGYTVASAVNTRYGLTAQLSLAGRACNAFGHDYEHLTIEVTYESVSRLHVSISDSAESQFRIPDSVIARPPPPQESLAEMSDLVFNYAPGPLAFEFWITRRADPDGFPLFDTRLRSLPNSQITPGDDNAAMKGFPLVFEDQYLQLTSALPLDANVYGLGEALASHGFRRDVGVNGGRGTIQTLWNRDLGHINDQNTYGTHPVYMEHRSSGGTSATHGVFLLSAAGGDVILATAPKSNVSVVQYRMIGGVFDLYFVSGPSPVEVIEQYAEIVGLPAWQPYWAFGLHLCRWGDVDINATKEHVTRMREADVPLEVIWNDIDMYHDFRDFTTDPVRFPADEVRVFIRELAGSNQHYIPIVDPYIGKQVNVTDMYDAYLSGAEQYVFVMNPDGGEHVGQSRPGHIVFPDWFADSAEAWWAAALQNWTDLGVEFSGLWLDKNEPSSPCNGVETCRLGVNIVKRSMPLPERERERGLIQSTFDVPRRCRLGAANQSGINVDAPPYAIHNGYGALGVHTMSMNATHATGYIELDVHNLFGLMEARATHAALHRIYPGKRPFMISRSTFPSAGRWTGHWLGDNVSEWPDMHMSIQGVLQFQLFQIPMVGADACGFNGNATEELCSRWMQLAAFHPFYRNHNVHKAIRHEPYQWESVVEATRAAIAVRYALLPYWYTLFANASRYGTPPVRALWFEFPTEEELFGIDRQFLVGCDVLITPVLEPGVSAVQGMFPGVASGTVWRDWYTHEVVRATPRGITTLRAPLGHINVHIRSGAALLLHAAPAYTTAETRAGPFALLIFLDAAGHAFGTAYLDDGESDPPGLSTELIIAGEDGNTLHVIPRVTGWRIASPLARVTVLGIKGRPKAVMLDDKSVPSGTWDFDAGLGRIVVQKLAVDLNRSFRLSWT